MNDRIFGLLHVRVVEGKQVHQSYGTYRLRTSNVKFYRRIVCGLDIWKCGGANPCGGKPSPYAVLFLQNRPDSFYRLGRTRSLLRTVNPVWNDEFSTVIDLWARHNPCISDKFEDPKGPKIRVTVYDDDLSGPYNDDLLGSVEVHLSTIITPALKKGQPIQAVLSLKHPSAKAEAHSISTIRIEFKWYSMISSIPGNMAIPAVYFRRTHGNLVTLYHDAHCVCDDFPDVPLCHGVFKTTSCFEAIAEAVENSKYFCLFAGWSINTATALKRPVEEALHEPIGELLKRKSEQGVRVIVMIWDDITSLEGNNFFKEGIMCTFDEYTRQFFKNTEVTVIVAPRSAGDDVGTMLYPVVGSLKTTSFTHHQKVRTDFVALIFQQIVLCDSDLVPTSDGRRILCSFVGGLDLTSGRFDTNRHELFSTLETCHKQDFHNGCIADAAATSGPREPWHDIHSRVVGPAAWDVMQNFTERMKCQSADTEKTFSSMLKNLVQDKKLKDGQTVLIHPQDSRSWDVQVFRSMDTESAVFDNTKFIDRYFSKKLMVDRSIHQAYLYLIEESKRFIYIENQYFLGSAQYWSECRETPAWHMVPYALCRRICRAIQESQPFSAYLLIPLFPEGIPHSMSIQEILHWQYQTIRMMYRRIGEKLKAVGDTVSHPMDYLQIYFVGKKEPDYPSQKLALPPKPSADLENAVNARRMQIYVHSKMMIIDDQYVILGSANINERSMAGCRDTEIAIGCCQPKYNAVQEGGDVSLPKGEVSAFRKNLWLEHFGDRVPEFEDPGSIKCVRMTQKIASQNWQAYSSVDNHQIPNSHICSYPLNISKDGDVKPLKTHPLIPGTSASVIGAPSAFLPSALTT